MNFTQAYALAYANFENSNPYEDRCDETRCVRGKTCTECNPEVDDEQ